MNHKTKNLDRTLSIARQLQSDATHSLTYSEKQKQAELARLVADPQGKLILTEITDQIFRSSDDSITSEQLTHILRSRGIPEYFTMQERTLLRIFRVIGEQLPRLATQLMPIVRWNIRRKTRDVILSGESQDLEGYLDTRQSEDLKLNLNRLGDAVMGAEEECQHLEDYKSYLRDPRVDTVSVKISTLYSQISSLAHEETVQAVVSRLRELYRVAIESADTPKMINLDMEEYRDLSITVEAFQQTLSESEFLQLSAGIALQAYIPESFHYLTELTQWARSRCEQGGAPIKIRIVKGANLEMEQIEASTRGWEVPTYLDKSDTDANYQKMIDYALNPDHLRSVHLGIATHNVFEMANAKRLIDERQLEENYIFEMLEGMSNHVRRAVQKQLGAVLLYAPTATQDQFLNAIAYLVRRLDENTSPDNFLSRSFDLAVDDRRWKELSDQHQRASAKVSSISSTPHRQQNRLTESHHPDLGSLEDFRPVADTDFTRASNRQWVTERIITPAERFVAQSSDIVPIFIGDQPLLQSRQSKPAISAIDGRVLAEFEQAREGDMQAAIEVAREDREGWGSLDLGERREVLAAVCAELKNSRAELIQAILLDVGKTVEQADSEVSEAIDFADYYPRTAQKFEDLDHLDLQPRGVVTVISPWNFPVSIPAGGVVAALTMGNRVILKPSSDSIYATRKLVECFWRAGVPRTALQFVPCAGAEAGTLTGLGVDTVVLTGGTETADRILANTPKCRLLAETGGKNTLIITERSDRELAIQSICASLKFNGQKCSAVSLLLLTSEVYRDQKFLSQLRDAVSSMKSGSALELDSTFTPLIHAPDEKLSRALTSLQAGESWLLEPRDLGDHLWTPGIKLGVQPGSESHLTEFFGPVLAVMQARDLSQACELANATGYGLTGGLATLDERERDYVREHLRVGNLYFEAPITGAIVDRQPFGGMANSRRGAGVKAGGVNYVLQFANISDRYLFDREIDLPDSTYSEMIADWKQKLDSDYYPEYREDIRRIIVAAKSYLFAQADHFSKLHYPTQRVRGQDNALRYRPIGKYLIRVTFENTPFEIVSRILAARIAGNEVIVSTLLSQSSRALLFVRSYFRDLLSSEKVQFISQTDSELVAHIRARHSARVRYTDPEQVPEQVHRAASQSGLHISTQAPLSEGRVELLDQYEEQVVSESYHRYGNLGWRGLSDSE